MSSITFDFTDRVALVTGAAQGIGRAIGQLFVDAGATLVAVDRDAAALAESWPAAGRVIPVAADVADPEDVKRVFTELDDRNVAADTVVNNAGVTRDAVVWKLDDAAWRTVMDVHVGGTFHFTREAVPRMRAAGFGRIINVTSYTGMHGTIGQSNYAAAKGGIIAFTKTAAKETARFGITVNAISPNAKTAMVEAVSDERLAAMTASVPLGRFAEPEEMAPAVGFLASHEAAYVTGVVLPVDGGVAM